MRSQSKFFWLIFPYLAGSTLLILLPAAATVVIAFFKYPISSDAVWLGLENFRHLFESSLVFLSLRNSFLFLALAVPLRIIGGLGLGLLYPVEKPLGRFYQTVIFLPTIIPEVPYALIWLWIFNPLYGPLNEILAKLGFLPTNWLSEPKTALLAIVIMLVFQLGEGYVVISAGIRSVPRDLYENARVDGASWWTVFWNITLPQIVPLVGFLIIRDAVVSLQKTFSPTYILTYGGPYYATTLAPLLVYELAFDFLDFGLASAFIVVMYLLLGAVVWALWNLSTIWSRKSGFVG